MRPKPRRSYSAENGLELILISRIDARGGNRPPVKPSTNICPPFGPADGPARAWRAAARSSGSSGSASISSPFNTTAPALFSGSVFTAEFEASTVTFCSSIATFRVMSSCTALLATTSTSVFSKRAKPELNARTV